MTRAVLSLGSNLGDRLATLASAVAALRPVAVSPVYETSPVGGPPQPDYLNLVVVVERAGSPADLLAECQALEAAAGRVRGERWGPRTLDVDVVTYGSVVSDDPALTLPHPRAAQRAFVLRPWLDVDPDATLPDGRRVADLLPAADQSGLHPRPDLPLPAPPTAPKITATPLPATPPATAPPATAPPATAAKIAATGPPATAAKIAADRSPAAGP